MINLLITFYPQLIKRSYVDKRGNEKTKQIFTIEVYLKTTDTDHRQVIWIMESNSTSFAPFLTYLPQTIDVTLGRKLGLKKHMGST